MRVSRSELERQVAEADYLLLGERHDNVDHHRLQAALLRAMFTGGAFTRGASTAGTGAAAAPPIVAWEMFDVEQQSDLDAYVGSHGKDARGLGEALGWSKSGWPPWESYLPIADASLALGLRLVAANLSRSTAKALVFQGPGALPPGTLGRLGLDTPLAAGDRDSLARELADAHCGHLPASHTDAMILAQRARDATLAEAMLAAAGDGRAVLIAGAGHARNDRGVGALLAKQRPGKKILALAFVEVDDAALGIEGYAGRFHAAVAPFDFVWLTPRASDEDPCASLKPAKPMGKTGTSASGSKEDRFVLEAAYMPGAAPFPAEAAARREAIAEQALWNEGGRGIEKWHPQPRVVVGQPVLLGRGHEKKAAGKKLKQRTKPPPKQTVGESDGFTLGAMRALRRFGYAGIRRCYDAALREDPALEGRTVVDFSVDASGRIISARASGGSAPDPRTHQRAMGKVQVRSCLASSLRTVSLPAPRGKRADARVSIDLWPGDVPLPLAEPAPLSGGLPPEAFVTTLTPALATVRGCFEALAAQKPAAWGRLALRLDADVEGRLVAVQTGSTFPDDGAVRCVETALSGLRLPAHAAPSRMMIAFRWKPPAHGMGGSPPRLPSDEQEDEAAPAETPSGDAEMR